MTALTGTRHLVRLALRRDRVLLPLWIVVLGLLPVLYASATHELYPTHAGLRQYYLSIVENPSLMSSIGPAFGSSLGALTVWRAGILFVFTGVISLLTVTRHTRAEEDAGRRELLGSTVAGRQAPLTAALLVTGGGNLVLGAVMAATLVGYGLPATGSLAVGAAFAASGSLFAAVGAVAAQLTQGAGAARASPSASSGWPSYCARPATPAARTATWCGCRGSPPSAGHSACGRTRTSSGGCSRRWSAAQRCSPGSPARCSPGGTRAPACCRSAWGGRRRPTRCAARSGWPGGCTVGYCSAGRSGSPPSAW